MFVCSAGMYVNSTENVALLMDWVRCCVDTIAAVRRFFSYIIRSLSVYAYAWESLPMPVDVMLPKSMP